VIATSALQLRSQLCWLVSPAWPPFGISKTNLISQVGQEGLDGFLLVDVGDAFEMLGYRIHKLALATVNARSQLVQFFESFERGHVQQLKVHRL
jgi:hypothetical protein